MSTAELFCDVVQIRRKFSLCVCSEQGIGLHLLYLLTVLCK